MKRFGNLWPLICSRENVSRSVMDVTATTLSKMRKRQAQQGRHFRPKPAEVEAMDIMVHFDEYVDRYQRNLIEGTYAFGEMACAEVNEGKKRQIDYPVHIDDRVYHHCLINVTGPLLISKMTADTYGSIKGRGITQLSAKMKRFLRGHPDWFYVQMDFRHYYENVSHECAKVEMRRAFKDSRVIEMYDRIIDHYGPGMAIGVFPSSYLANMNLSPLDHLLKEVERIPFLVRYMDDIVCVVKTKAEARRILGVVKAYGAARGLEVKGSARIAPVSSGIDLCGYVFYPTHTRLRKSIKLKMKRNVRKWKYSDDATFKRKLASHFGWCKHANCRNLVRKTLGDKYYIFEKNMEYRRIIQHKSWFGLPKEARISILELENKDVWIHEYMDVIVDGVTKLAVCFSFPDDIEERHYFLTSGKVFKDRLEQNAERIPGVTTIRYDKKKRYFYPD